MAKSALDRLSQYFDSHPNQWVSALTVAEIGGLFSFRQRLSELREQGFVIENKLETVDGMKHSFYRYTKPEPRQLSLPTEKEIHAS